MSAQTTKLLVHNRFIGIGAAIVAGAASGVMIFSQLFNAAPSFSAIAPSDSRKVATMRQEELKDAWLAH